MDGAKHFLGGVAQLKLQPSVRKVKLDEPFLLGEKASSTNPAVPDGHKPKACTTCLQGVRVDDLRWRQQRPVPEAGFSFGKTQQRERA